MSDMSECLYKGACKGAILLSRDGGYSITPSKSYRSREICEKISNSGYMMNIVRRMSGTEKYFFLNLDQSMIP